MVEKAERSFATTNTYLQTTKHPHLTSSIVQVTKEITKEELELDSFKTVEWKGVIKNPF